MKPKYWFLPVLAGAALAVSTAWAAPIQGLYNTGVDDSGVALADNAVDPHYTIVTNANAATTEAYAASDAPIPPWVANSAISRWIVPTLGAGAAGAAGIYTYQTTFDLTGLDHSTAVITGRWSSDNDAPDIILNGVSLGISYDGNFGGFGNFTIDTGFAAGFNVLQFVVNNAGLDPTGLRVEMTGTTDLPGTPPSITQQPQSFFAGAGETVTFAVEVGGSPPFTFQWLFNGTNLPPGDVQNLVLSDVTTNDAGTYALQVSNSAGSVQSSNAILRVGTSIATLFNTGVDDFGDPLFDNSIDPHYTFTVNPDGATPDTIVVNSLAFPIVAGPWLPNSATSKWIGPRFDTSAAAEGAYTYRTTFDLAGFDAATAEITGQWATDDGGVSLLVNGVATGITHGGGFTSYSTFVINSGNATFNGGLNTIEFVVNNGSPGYTGLRVENLRGAGITLPEGTPPEILSPPADLFARETEDAVFSVSAEGSPPLSYQWLVGEIELPGETNPTLVIPDITILEEGDYSVTVSNPYGSVTSDPAFLTVGPRLELGSRLINRLSVGGLPGTTNRIEYADDPDNPVWQTLTNILLRTDPTLFIDTRSADAPRRIYRVIRQP